MSTTSISRRTAGARLFKFLFGAALFFRLGKSARADGVDPKTEPMTGASRHLILKTYTRVVTSNLDATLKPLQALVGRAPDIRIPLPFSGVELVALGDFFVISGKEKALKPFRGVLGPVIVADLDATRAVLAQAGAKIDGKDVKVSTGRFLISNHPDGVQIEWLEWRPEIVEQLKLKTHNQK